MNATSASTFCGPSDDLKVDGMTPLGKPGEMYAFGSSIDCFTNAASCILSFFASASGAVSRSGPTFALVPAALNVWQAPQPAEMKTAFPFALGAAAAVGVAAVVVAGAEGAATVTVRVPPW